MKLIVITQKVDINDDNLGFFHRWIEKFSEKLEKVYVICLAKGTYNFPKNVVVYSLGKERGVSKIGQFFRLQKYLFKILPKTDGVFFHMCPIYAIASFSLTKAFKKKTILWFLHRSVNCKLKLASRLVNELFTASEKSCRLKNRKRIKVVGHGIDTGFFKPGQKRNQKFNILFVGRITPLKDLETLIGAVDILVKQKNIQDVEVKIIGSPLESYEERYAASLKKSIEEKGLTGYISFFGGLPQREILRFYQESDVLVNLSPTGGMDKVILEAMACSTPVLACNQAFREDFGDFADKLIFQEKNPQDLAQKMLNLRNSDTIKLGSYLREQVVKSHNLDNLTDKIINAFQR